MAINLLLEDATPRPSMTMDAVPLTPHHQHMSRGMASPAHARMQRSSSLFSGSTLRGSEVNAATGRDKQEAADSSGRYAERVCSVLFPLHLLLLTVVAGVLLYLSLTGKFTSEHLPPPQLLWQGHMLAVAVAVMLPTLGAVLLSLLWLVGTRHCAAGTLYTTLVLSVLVPAASCVLFGLLSQWTLLILAILLCLLMLYGAVRALACIPYAVVLLREVSWLLMHRPGLWCIAIAAALFLTGYIALCAVIQYSAFIVCGRLVALLVVMPILLLALCWTHQVLMYLVFLVTGRVFAASYWPVATVATDGRLFSNTLSGLRYARQRVGALCYGTVLSLLTLNGTITIAAREDSCSGGLLARLSTAGTYTFAYIAVLGRRFHRAGREVQTLISARQMTSAYSASALAGVSRAVSTAVATLLAVLAAVVVQFGLPSIVSDHQDWMRVTPRTVAVLAYAFLTALLVVFLMVTLIRAGVQTLLVCIAVDPAHFRYDHADFWDAFSAVYPDFEHINVPISSARAEAHAQNAHGTDSLSARSQLDPSELPVLA